MNINPKDYRQALKFMTTGQNIKVKHKNCSDSKALSITMHVEGFGFKCFKCDASGFLAHEDTGFRDRKVREAEFKAYQAERIKAGFNLPADAGHSIDPAGLAWLGSGGWTNDLIFKYGPLWSNKMQRVIFKVDPMGWIARAVHDDQVPKYLSKTIKLSWWVSEPIVDRCCITEDILSAGKVGQLYPAMAALGTDQFNIDILTKCKQVLIWTDGDAGGDKARKKVRDVLQWVPTVQVLDIHSPKDPKKYSNRELRERLMKGGAIVHS